jgi:hypothetical protein
MLFMRGGRGVSVFRMRFGGVGRNLPSSCIRWDGDGLRDLVGLGALANMI